jgi:hypothetical protein
MDINPYLYLEDLKYIISKISYIKQLIKKLLAIMNTYNTFVKLNK